MSAAQMGGRLRSCWHPQDYIQCRKCALTNTPLLVKLLTATGLAFWHENTEILCLSSFLQFSSCFLFMSQTFHISCTKILRKKPSFTTQIKGFFSNGCAQVMVELRKNVLIFNLWSHSVLLLTLSLADVCCVKPYQQLLFFVGIKKCCRGFFTSLSFIILHLLSTSWNPSFPYLSKAVKCLFISFLKGTRFSNQPFPAFP